MKSFVTLLAALFFISGLYAQAPDKVTYQSVIRDANNDLVKSASVGLRISILQGSTTSVLVYEETHSTSTNANGLVSIEIGDGTVTSGDFSSIDWADGPFFIQTETDPTGGVNYTIDGTSELQSVPFALHATSAATAVHATIADSLNGGEIDPLFGASVANGITAVDTAHWNDHTVDTQIDSTGIAAMGYVAGPHNDDQTLSLSGTNLTIEDGNTVDLAAIDTDTQLDSAGVAALGYAAGPHTVNTDSQTLGLSGTSISISNGNTVDLSSIDTDTDDQTLSLSGTNLSIEDGNTIDLSSIDTDTQLDSAGVAGLGYVAGPHTVNTDSQTLGLSGTSISISNGNTVDLSLIDTDTDDQTLSLSGTNLSIADGNTIDLSSIDTDTQLDSAGVAGLGFVAGAHTVNTDNQTLSLSGTTVSISGGNTLNLSSINTDAQTVSLSSTTLSISGGNSVDLSSIDTDTDDQTLSLSGTTLSIADGNAVSLSSINTDTQTVSLSGSTLSISGGNSVSLSGIDTDDQTLSLSGSTLSIAGGNSVDLSSIDTDTDTDDQTLSLSGTTLSIADGNSVNLSAVTAGSDQQITFNDNDSAGADAELVYDKTSNHMAIGTSTVNTDAALEINSTSGGLLLPRMTEAQRDALTPAVGMVIFNTDSGTFQGYAGYPQGTNVSFSDNSYLGNLSLAGQAFTATADGSWTKLQLNFQSTVTGGTLQIYAGNGVSGSPIHTQSFTVGTGEQEIILTTPVELISGNQYSFTTGVVCAYYPFASYSGGTSYTSTISFPGNLWFKVITGDAEWVDLH